MSPAQKLMEKKTIDIDIGSYNMGTSLNIVTLLNGVAQGTDFTNRIGRTIVIHSVFIRGQILPTDASTLFNPARILFVYDMQTNGATPAATDILKQDAGLGQLNLNNRSRFKVFYDRTFPIGQITNTATQTYAAGPNYAVFKKYKKCNFLTVFSGTGATVASIQSGAIWMVTCGNGTAAECALLQASIRVRFLDA